MLHFPPDNKSGRQRASKMSLMDVLVQLWMYFLFQKYDKKAELKEKELEIRKMELDLQEKKDEIEVEEITRRLEVEMEERKHVAVADD